MSETEDCQLGEFSHEIIYIPHISPKCRLRVMVNAIVQNILKHILSTGRIRQFYPMSRRSILCENKVICCFGVSKMRDCGRSLLDSVELLANCTAFTCHLLLQFHSQWLLISTTEVPSKQYVQELF